MDYKVIKADCVTFLKDSMKELKPIDLTFLDPPPFNQNKNYAFHNDDLPEKDYWKMVDNVCKTYLNRHHLAELSILCKERKTQSSF